MPSEPYHIQLAFGGQVPPHLAAPAELQGDCYLVQMARVGGMFMPEIDLAIRYGGMLPLDRAMEALLKICDAEPPLFQDIFLLEVPQDTRKQLGESFTRDLERRVSLHNQQFVHLLG